MLALRSILCIALTAGFISFGFCCTEDEWMCNSGQCINLEELCDGKTDCDDTSDETVDSCIHENCPEIAYRCAYGACVAGNARCNGITECADESDEKCSDLENKNCLDHQFQCIDGGCIDMENSCDGHPDCLDQSDESVEACASNVCYPYAFRCGYGACIAGTMKCDGKFDCRDGSDETFNLCGVQPKSWPIGVFPSLPTSWTGKGACIAPTIMNSRLKIESTQQILHAGEKVSNMTSIIYECRTGFFREGLDYNICINGNWFSKIHPICTRYCPHEVLRGVTFTVICIRNGNTVPCNKRIKPGTLAKISCSTKYRIPEHNPQQTLLCSDDGRSEYQWDYQPSRCEPICGEELVPTKPFLAGGENTNISTVPWHVAIYKRVVDEYKYHCGGTLLNAKVVISAAHCFWDNANQITDFPFLYTIGAGKQFREYNRAEPRKVQFSSLAQICIHPHYKGADTLFKDDIAVIVLTNALILSEFVSPICIQWPRVGVKLIVNGTYGQVAGWGRDESGDWSNELKTILVPASSNAVCKNEAGPELSGSLTNDKFCVINKLNANACEGDSGGGFVVKEGNRFYLWGVVSTGVPYGTSCSSYQLVSYTNIQYHELFITEIETHNRPK